MAGTLNNDLKRTGRKKWSILKSSDMFRRQGSNLAEDGCPVDQFNLALELLERDCGGYEFLTQHIMLLLKMNNAFVFLNSVLDQEECAREGIYWLVKASEQGHLEATDLLKECLATGKGITEHNLSDVMLCIETSTNEKLSVKAMRRLFSKCSEGEEFITNRQLFKKLNEMHDINGKPIDLPQIKDRKYNSQDWKAREATADDKLTEDMLVSAARMYSRGKLPTIGQFGVVSKRDSFELTSPCSSSLCRVLLLPFVIDRLYLYLLSFDLHTVFSMLHLSTTHLKLLLLLLICSCLNFDVFVSSFPNIAYYSSFLIMVAATCHMLKYRQYFLTFRRWSNLFLQYGSKKFTAEEAEYLHCRNGFPSYISFFLCLLVNLFVLSSFPHSSFFQAEITFVSFFFTVLTLLSFTFSKARYMTYSRRFDYLAMFSFMLHVLAKYPYETDSVVGVGWRFLDLQIPTFASYVVGHGIEFCLNFRAVFYLAIPAVLFKMAARHQWRGIYSDLIPHCVTLSWWQMTLIYAEDITWHSLIRPALAFAGIIFFLPLTVLASIFLPIFAAINYLHEYESWTTVTTLVAAFLIPTLVLRRYFTRSPLKNHFYFICQVLFTMMTICLLLYQSSSSLVLNFQKSLTEVRSVEVEEFTAYCNSFQPQYTDFARIENQLQCSQMAGVSVHWKGKVRNTQISKIHNSMSTIVNKFPKFLTKYLYCWLGEEYSSFKLPFCKSLVQSCHLSNWNRYETRINVDVYLENGEVLPVTLVANNNFFNVTRKLNTNDDVWFNGIIIADEMGLVDSDSPLLQLSRLTCVSCLRSDLTETTDAIQISFLHFYNFFKYMFNVVLNPVLVFK